MIPVFTIALARDAVARQFDYSDAPATAALDVAPAALPRRRPSVLRVLRHRLRGPSLRTTWSPSR